MKLVVAREVARKAKALVIFDPTAGLDVMTIAFIHQKIIEASENAAILLVSTDLDELLSLSNRIAVIFNGKVTEAPQGFTREALGLMMTGGEG